MNKFKITGTNFVRTTAHVYTHAVVAISPAGAVSVKGYCSSLVLGQKLLSFTIASHARSGGIPGYRFELRDVEKI